VSIGIADGEYRDRVTGHRSRRTVVFVYEVTMNREIKFRGWNKVGKRMVDLKALTEVRMNLGNKKGIIPIATTKDRETQTQNSMNGRCGLFAVFEAFRGRDRQYTFLQKKWKSVQQRFHRQPWDSPGSIYKNHNHDKSKRDIKKIFHCMAGSLFLHELLSSQGTGSAGPFVIHALTRSQKSHDTTLILPRNADGW
jgi:hypothetical protein